MSHNVDFPTPLLERGAEDDSKNINTKDEPRRKGKSGKQKAVENDVEVYA